jgi:hypothetical protein
MALVRNSFASALQNFLAGSAPLPLANGGTGATTAPDALTSLNGLDASFRDLPIVVKSANFTFSNAERGNGIEIAVGTGAITGTIDPTGTTPINNGAVYVIANFGNAAVTISRGSGVSLFKNGSTSSADAVVAVGGQATLIRWGTDVWMINGSGVS